MINCRCSNGCAWMWSCWQGRKLWECEGVGSKVNNPGKVDPLSLSAALKDVLPVTVTMVDHPGNWHRRTGDSMPVSMGNAACSHYTAGALCCPQCLDMLQQLDATAKLDRIMCTGKPRQALAQTHIPGLGKGQHAQVGRLRPSCRCLLAQVIPGSVPGNNSCGGLLCRPASWSASPHLPSHRQPTIRPAWVDVCCHT